MSYQKGYEPWSFTMSWAERAAAVGWYIGWFIILPLVVGYVWFGR